MPAMARAGRTAALLVPLVLSVLVVLLVAGTPVRAATAAMVQTRDGPVRGVVARLPQVEVFKGLPYAAAPVGALRWAAPQAPAPWSGVRGASQFGASCPQPASKVDPSDPASVSPAPQSEDCLYLNVWRPARAPATLPVLVWIHGGAFVFGSGALPLYDGSALAQRGVLVVTLNYRIGPFGYLAHPALSAAAPGHVSGNYALRDQVAALTWVRNNIAAFGGDPAQVTIAGHSGGGVSVSSLLVSPLARGLFARAIVQSGPISGLAPPTRTLAEAEALGQQSMARRHASSLAELRALSTAEVLDPVPGDVAWPSPYGPIVDGAAMPSQPADAFVAGQQARVPLLIGVAAAESAAMSGAAATPARFERFVMQLFGSDGARVLAAYPHASDAEAQDSQAAVKRDQMLAATLAYATCHARSGAPAYVYYFDQAPPGPDSGWQRAYHGAELAYVFDNLDALARPWTAADREFAGRLSGYWLAFIRSGNPNANANQESGDAWARFAPGAAPFRLHGDGKQSAYPSTEALQRFFAAGNPHLQAYGQATPTTTGCL